MSVLSLLKWEWDEAEDATATVTSLVISPLVSIAMSVALLVGMRVKEEGMYDWVLGEQALVAATAMRCWTGLASATCGLVLTVLELETEGECCVLTRSTERSVAFPPVLWLVVVEVVWVVLIWSVGDQGTRDVEEEESDEDEETRVDGW